MSTFVIRQERLAPTQPSRDFDNALYLVLRSTSKNKQQNNSTKVRNKIEMRFDENDERKMKIAQQQRITAL